LKPNQAAVHSPPRPSNTPTSVDDERVGCSTGIAEAGLPGQGPMRTLSTLNRREVNSAPIVTPPYSSETSGISLKMNPKKTVIATMEVSVRWRG
jgi:hypothetical protein